MSTSNLSAELSNHLTPIILPQPTGLTELNTLNKQRLILEKAISTYRNASNASEADIEVGSGNSKITESVPSSMQSKIDKINTILEPILSSPSSTSSSNSAPTKAYLDLVAKLTSTNELIALKEGELKGISASETKQGMNVNDKGEMLNEEGLPFIGINFEEDVPYVARGPSASNTTPSSSTPTPTASSSTTTPKVRVGGLIQRGGKQTLIKSKVLDSFAPPSPFSNLPPSKSESQSKEFEFNAENEELLARLELEEQKEAEAEAKAELEKEKSQLAATVPLTSSSIAITTPNPITATTPKPPSIKKPLTGFKSGFLTAKPKSTMATPIPPITSTTPIKPLASSSTDDQEPRHEPLHHILPPSKSIYRPTPPSSVPNSRPSSPKPSDKKVVFNLPEGLEEETAINKSKKKGKEVIILGGPEAANETDSKPAVKKAPFFRPLKEVVVERPIKSPSLPKPKIGIKFTKTAGDGLPIRTVGIAPKSTVSPPQSPLFATISQPSTSISNPIATPIHTLSLSTKSNSLPSGHLSVANFTPEDDQSDSDEHSASELRPSLTSDGSEDSDSSGFYGSDFDEEDDEEDEIDIDGALHNREVALEYHRLRMNVGAGAGTGPLGGDRDPDAYDSWNQANVPTEASMQGRTPGSHSSRFRTGRLESAQMIIPSLISEHIRTNLDQVSDDEEERDDGLTPEERENIRNTLAELAGKVDEGGRSDMNGRRQVEKQESVRINPSTSTNIESISQMLDEVSISTPTSSSINPTTGTPISNRISRMATPISVPSNPPISRMREDEFVPAVIAEPVKKMSRFKARQLGLEEL